MLEAQAYLLERLGDIPAALDIYVQQLEQAARALVDAVLSGRVPAAQLQAAGHPRASHSRLLGQRHPAPSNLDLPAEVNAPSAEAAVSRQRRFHLSCQKQSPCEANDIALLQANDIALLLWEALSYSTGMHETELVLLAHR